MTYIEGYNFPDELYYHIDHAWVKIESNGNVRVGINDFYQKSAGDITNMDIPFEGDEVAQGKTCGRIESGKWIGKFVSPISGEIIKANIELELNPSLINKSPYKKGWIIVIKPSNLDDEVKNLFQVDDVKPFLDSGSIEYRKMVEWMTSYLNATTLQYQLLEDMVEAIGLPEENLCLYCWNGRSLSYDYDPRQRELNLL